MLGTIIETLKAIIDLIRKGREDKKLGLEIENLEREQREHQRVIQPATFDDVKAFDPKFNLIRARTERARGYAARAPLPGLAWVVVVAVLLAGILALAWFLFRARG